MKTILRHRLRAAVPAIAVLLAPVIGAFATSAHAALEIKKSDITETNNVFTYNYSFTYADMIKMINDAGRTPTATSVATTGKFFDDIFSTDGSTIRLMVEANTTDQVWTNAYIQANGTGAQISFTYKFDFTDAGYEIASFTVKDSLYAANQDRAVVTQYSTDGTTWTDTEGNLTNILRTTAGNAGIQGGTSSLITLASGVSTLYYRVLFTSLDGTTSTTFGTQQSWNRTNAGLADASTFAINVTLTPVPVPEPATVTMLTGASVLVFGLLRRLRSLPPHSSSQSDGEAANF
jgi:hypothetical protein